MKAYYLFFIISFLASIVSCRQTAGPQADHEHNENLYLTSYNADFEVFAEATPFVRGSTSEILAHFTWLKDFKPLESGKVTAKLMIGNSKTGQTVETPVKPGIYRFSVTPENEGDGKLVFEIVAEQGTSIITVDDIKVYSNEHDAFHAAEDAAPGTVNGAIFTKEQSWKIDFSTEVIDKQSFGQVIRTIGQIQPTSGDERIITAKTSGIVIFSGENVVDGRPVNAGQSLFSIDASGMADNNLSVRLSETESEYNRAKAEYERKAALAKDRIVSQSDLLRAETELANAEANYNNLRRNFSAGRQSVSSPIKGFITNVLVRNGQFTEAGQPVLVVSQNQNLYIKAEIQPKHFNQLNNITGVNFRQLQNNNSYTLEELGGKLVSFGKSTDLSNPLIPVIFQINNRAGFLPGSFIEMFIRVQFQNETLSVPNEAIVEEMGNYFLYVQLTPELFDKRLIRKGETDGLRTEILSGISEGERVVGKGAIMVKLAQSAGAIDPHAGHVH